MFWDPVNSRADFLGKSPVALVLLLAWQRGLRDSWQCSPFLRPYELQKAWISASLPTIHAGQQSQKCRRCGPHNFILYLQHDIQSTSRFFSVLVNVRLILWYTVHTQQNFSKTLIYLRWTLSLFHWHLLMSMQYLFLFQCKKTEMGFWLWLHIFFMWKKSVF